MSVVEALTQTLPPTPWSGLAQVLSADFPPDLGELGLGELGLGDPGPGDPTGHVPWGPGHLLVQLIAVAVTAFVPPFPAELMVITSGTMAAEGVVSAPEAFAVTMLGCLLGDVAVHLLFRRQVLRVLHRRRWGRQLHRRLLRITLRAGGATTWAGLLLIRAIPGGRSASMATAGMLRISWPAMTLLALAGAATWSAWLFGLGYITGTTTGLPPWASIATAAAAGTLVGVIAAGVASRRRRTSTRRGAGRTGLAAGDPRGVPAASGRSTVTQPASADARARRGEHIRD